VKRKIVPCQEKNHGYPACSIVSMLTELSQLLELVIAIIVTVFVVGIMVAIV
jgi:hypothetical protein